MKKYLNKVLLILMVVFLVPCFANGGTKPLLPITGDITCVPTVSSTTVSSVAENSQVTWEVKGIDGYDTVSYLWSGTGVDGVSTPTATATYASAGAVSGVSVTLTDASGLLTIPCGSLTVAKSLSQSTGSDITCAPTTPSIAENTPATWAVTIPSDYGSVSYLWSGTGVDGVSTPTATATYASAGSISGVSVTLADASGLLTIPCGSLTVNVPVSGITINNGGSDNITTGNTDQLTAIISPSNATNTNVVWSSSNTAVATVDSATGKVTAVSAGSVTITATTTDGNFVATYNLTISNPATGGGGGGGGGSILPAAKTCKMADINCDGFVNEYDFSIMMTDWGNTGATNPADINKLGIVNEYDFSLLMAYWGS